MPGEPQARTLFRIPPRATDGAWKRRSFFKALLLLPAGVLASCASRRAARILSATPVEVRAKKPLPPRKKSRLELGIESFRKSREMYPQDARIIDNVLSGLSPEEAGRAIPLLESFFKNSSYSPGLWREFRLQHEYAFSDGPQAKALGLLSMMGRIAGHVERQPSLAKYIAGARKEVELSTTLLLLEHPDFREDMLRSYRNAIECTKPAPPHLNQVYEKHLDGTEFRKVHAIVRKVIQKKGSNAEALSNAASAIASLGHNNPDFSRSLDRLLALISMDSIGADAMPLIATLAMRTSPHITRWGSSEREDRIPPFYKRVSSGRITPESIKAASEAGKRYGMEVFASCLLGPSYWEGDIGSLVSALDSFAPKIRKWERKHPVDGFIGAEDYYGGVRRLASVFESAVGHPGFSPRALKGIGKAFMRMEKSVEDAEKGIRGMFTTSLKAFLSNPRLSQAKAGLASGIISQVYQREEEGFEQYALDALGGKEGLFSSDKMCDKSLMVLPEIIGMARRGNVSDLIYTLLSVLDNDSYSPSMLRDFRDVLPSLSGLRGERMEKALSHLEQIAKNSRSSPRVFRGVRHALSGERDVLAALASLSGKTGG